MIEGYVIKKEVRGCQSTPTLLDLNQALARHFTDCEEKWPKNELQELEDEQESVGEEITKKSQSGVYGLGNTQVACHVGVSSCGQRHRNTFTFLITFLHYR